MKLKKIRISYMDHPQALSFYDEVLTYLCGINTISFETLLDNLTKAVSDFRDSYNVYNRNFLMRQISLEQRNLQHNLMSLKYRLKKNQESADLLLVNLSKKAMIVLNYYCTAKHVSVNRKDDKIFTIVDALEDFMTERERLAIGVSTYLKNLKKINANLKELIERRDAIRVNRTVHNLIPDRHNADHAYRDLITYLNIQIRRNPENLFLIDIWEKLDELIMKQSEEISSRISKSKNVPSASGHNMGVA